MAAKLTVRLCVGVLSAALLLVACGDSTETITQPEPTGTVSFEIDNVVDGDPLQLGPRELLYTNSSGTLYGATKVVYLISNITLHATDGSTYGVAGPHFRDAEDGATRSFSISGVPKRTYDMVSFTFGLDEAMNVDNMFLNEPWHGEMAWPGPMGRDQGLGYHYMKFEGNFETTLGDTTGFLNHTGARWCASPCPPNGETDLTPKHHYFRVSLPVDPMKVSGDNWTVMLEVNLNGWFADHTPGDGFDTEYDWNNLPMQMIMGNDEAQRMLQANGPGCFSATSMKSP